AAMVTARRQNHSRGHHRPGQCAPSRFVDARHSTPPRGPEPPLMRQRRHGTRRWAQALFLLAAGGHLSFWRHVYSLATPTKKHRPRADALGWHIGSSNPGTPITGRAIVQQMIEVRRTVENK